MRSWRVGRLAAVLIALLSSQSLSAQETGNDALRRQQKALFQQMIRDPSDLDAMTRHATVSVQLQDYEAAIATLERMLIFEQNLPRVRLELGTAYFNLGSYAASTMYFDQVIADPTAPADFKATAKNFKAEIARRTTASSFDGTARVGITYSTNANLGPASNELVLFGQRGYFLAPAIQPRADAGVQWLVSGTHTFDLQRPNDDAWVTDLGLFGVRYFDAEVGNALVARLRTGPRLALTDENSGPKIRPYVEGLYVNSADRTTYFAGFVGTELAAPIAGKWSAFGDFNIGYFDFERRRNRQDEFSVRVLGGVAYQPERDIVLRAAAIAEYSDAATDFNSSFEIGTRLSGEYRYDSGLAAVDRKWTVSGYLDARYRFFEAPDALIDPTTTRDEFDLRAGVSHLFAIRDGFGIRLDVEGFLREANIRNFDTNALTFTLSAEYSF